MAFVALAFGARGDVEPLAVLTAALAERGTEARIVVPEDQADVAREAGAETFTLPVSVEDLAPGNRLPWRHGGFSSRLLRKAGRASADALLDTIGEGDTVVGGLLARELLQALEDGRGCRPVTMLLTANLPTTSYDSRVGVDLLDETPHIGSAGARVGWHVRALAGAPLAAPVRARLGLPRMRWLGVHSRPSAHPIIVAVSPLIVPPAADWPLATIQTGYLAAPPQEINPSPELTEFLDDGAPPLYVGFGSLTEALPERIHAMIPAAARRAGVRVVTPAGPDRRTGLLRRDVFVTPPVAHSWLFPQMAGVVHHGGAGTMWSALRSGVASAAVPAAADQPYHAERLHTLGVGPAPIPMPELTVGGLARLLLDLDSGAFDHRATDIGNLAAAEDGVGETITALETLGLV